MKIRWQMTPLKDLVHLHYGSALKAEDRNEEGVFTVFGSNGPVGKHIDRLVDYPTLIVGRKGSVGSVFFAPEGGWPIDTTYYTEIISPARINIRYLYYALKQAGLNRHTIITSIPGLNRDAIYRTSIPLPYPDDPARSLAEQKRIADILDKADAIRRKRQEAILHSQSLFISALEGQLTSHLRGTHSFASLGDVCTKLTDGTHLTPQFNSQGIPFIFVKNIVNHQIDFATDKFIDAATHSALMGRAPVEMGDVLYTIVGATYGQAALVETSRPFAFQRHIAHLKPDVSKVRSKYLAAIMNLPRTKHQADRWARGAAQPTLNLKELREMTIPLLPMADQDDIVALKEQCERLIRTQTEASRQQADLFSTLVLRAFRGEL